MCCVHVYMMQYSVLCTRVHNAVVCCVHVYMMQYSVLCTRVHNAVVCCVHVYMMQYSVLCTRVMYICNVTPCQQLCVKSVDCSFGD